MIDLHKKIFITGVTGFVGSNLVHRLIALGASDVHVLIREGADTSRIDGILDTLHIHSFSLEDRESTISHIREICPQIVYHVAARGTAVGRAPFTLAELIDTNTVGTSNLIDAARETGSCEVFVHTGSSSEYGAKDHPMREDEVLEPNNLYGISKAAAAHYASWIGKSTGFPIVTYRLFSVYGPLEDQKRLISTLFQCYQTGTTPSLSSPYSVRDYIYIDDVVDYYLEADQAIRYPGEILNIGTGVQHSIADLIPFFQEVFDSEIEPVYGAQKPNQFEPKCWCADTKKTESIFSLRPKSFREGIQSMLPR